MNESEKKHGPAAWVWFRTHVLLMPPGVPLDHSEKRARKKQAKGTQQEGQGAPDVETLDAWTQPAEATPPTPRASSSGTEASAGSWAVENEKTFGAALAKVLRVLLIVVLVFVCFVGVRELFFPAQSTTVVKEVETKVFPTAAAASVATRHVGAYLTIDPDEAALAQRQRILALGSASESTDVDTAGVAGKQSVSDLSVVRVAQLEDGRARALVTGTVTDYEPDKDKWKAGEARPVAAEVLLIQDETGAVSVLGQPALVSTTPSPVAGAPDPAAQQDSTVTTATQADAESFFSSYGADASVTASVAPGVEIAGLEGGAEFSSLSSWTVYDGGDEKRTALATVAWTLPSGIELTQTYTLTLSSVSADETGGWQISAVSGGGTTS